MPFRKRTGSSAVDDSVTNELEPWMEVQLRVYTNWVNDKLKSTGQSVSNLPKDLEDGLILIKLLELLSGKKVNGK